MSTSKTYRLFDLDSHLFTFWGLVQSCEKNGDRFAVVLDRTAFFPEAGGQSADTGLLDGKPVLHVEERDGLILHWLGSPLEIGACVKGEVEEKVRSIKMQNHTGEHILSGLAHRYYGCENVGFHLSETEMTVDFDKELSASDLERLETEANEIITRNVKIRTYYPSPEELPNLTYRSKLDLCENVRLVEIEGVDLCACCAPHAERTGEVGLLKILDAIRYKGGMRLHVVCGRLALDDYRDKSEQMRILSQNFSVPQSEVANTILAFVQTSKKEQADKAEQVRTLQQQSAQKDLDLQSGRKLRYVLFPFFDEPAIRHFINKNLREDEILVALTDIGEGAFRFIAGSDSIPLRQWVKQANSALCGKGGGSDQMVQGTWCADLDAIHAYLQLYF
ncbi:MAG: alanyl-tRNA editing protein [Clostridia bacterium]|nr:alanyl-tRNA editing protein [Clostridia bacterium]